MTVSTALGAVVTVISLPTICKTTQPYVHLLMPCWFACCCFVAVVVVVVVAVVVVVVVVVFLVTD